ncbi:MAG: hypothetical protein FWB96_04920 [Defluviitaleaceae bacterium]|nr:hypothetical protein [Defluviitaleaceae bacterium]MCL2262223.1 hypothetical protein [Defluviitaleaceae bacterium]
MLIAVGLGCFVAGMGFLLVLMDLGWVLDNIWFSLIASGGLALGVVFKLQDLMGEAGVNYYGLHCPSCKKQKSKEISRTQTKQERIQIQKEETIKHYGKNQVDAVGRPTTPFPESVTTRKYSVPATRTHYNVKYTCQACRTQFTGNIHEDTE